MKKVLMIAFHFPPVAMGSGHLRTLGFVRYLPDLGWEPTVLSVNAAAFPRVDAGNLSLIPDNCRVHRAFALDVRRHLSIRGKYPGFLVQPDRWASWWPAAVWQGLRLIRRHQISAIWSTYPIMTAHGIAGTLSRLTGLPWIADFRDPVASSVEAGNPFSVSSQQRLERRVLARARRIVFTTPGALERYAEHYPEASREGRLAVVPNGYDEAAFAGLPSTADRQPQLPLKLVHSGILYPEGRNPLPFFTALANLKSAGALDEGDVRIVLRASGSEGTYADEIRRRGLEGMVTLAPPVANREALLEQAEADGLLLFQGSKFDDQIPAKVYEYLRIGRPIFGLVGEGGDTEAVLRETGGALCVPLDDVAAIETRLLEFLSAVRAGRAPRVKQDVIARYSRRESTGSLARMFDQVIAERAR
ncbi:MAG: glycosyltransferase [Halothiobacillus sp.]|nr:glycosyltransferase [Halothiobacillus sp.]